jgi:hypothetical protein
MSVTLGGITLPDDLVWVDEFDFEPVAQASARTLGGVLISEETELLAGRDITLGAAGQWVERSVVIALRALAADAGETHTLSLRGTDYTVQFRRPAIEARPVIEQADPLAVDPYEIRINLRTVA